ncbi:MAG: hypothetical protein GX558_10205 [Clostridiales bacterium]|nr:hypothetical protein [Clostridiales bacterium]
MKWMALVLCALSLGGCALVDDGLVHFQLDDGDEYTYLYEPYDNNHTAYDGRLLAEMSPDELREAGEFRYAGENVVAKNAGEAAAFGVAVLNAHYERWNDGNSVYVSESKGTDMWIVVGRLHDRYSETTPRAVVCSKSSGEVYYVGGVDWNSR